LTVLGLEALAVRWSRRLALLGGGLLLGVALTTAGDATLRYGLSRPIPGMFELTELVLASIIFFGLPYTGILDGHVSVDIVTARLGPRARHALVAMSALVVAALLGAITWEMLLRAGEVLRTGRTTITARIPELPFMVPVTIASGLATLAALIQAAGAVARIARPDLGAMPAPRDEPDAGRPGD
jgi:TRAP-type C4-dicarboxylate transport system permease small subunit